MLGSHSETVVFWTFWKIVGHSNYSIDSWSRRGHFDDHRFVVKASFCLSLVLANRQHPGEVNKCPLELRKSVSW